MTIRVLNQKFTLGELFLLFKKGFKILTNYKKLTNLIKFKFSLSYKPFRYLNYYPIIVNVEPTSHCNLRCPMCSISYENLERKKGYLDLDVYKRFVDEMSDYIILLCLWNVGEPLLHPCIAEMVSYARDRHVLTAMHTNGVELKGKLADDIINSGLDYLSISFDGATKEIYERFRRGANFEQVVENIRNFCRRKKELNSASPIVNMQFIIMKENEHQLVLFKALAESLEVNKISYKRFTHVPLTGDTDDTQLLEKFLPSNKKFIYKAFEKSEDKEGCKRVWVSSAMTYNADISACCVDSLNQFIFGNIRERNFKDIWNDKGYRHFRKLVFNNPDAVDTCKKCMLKDYFADQQI